MQLTEFKNDLSPAKILKNKLLSDGRSYTWLARKVQRSISCVHYVLNEKQPLSDEMKEKMSKILEITD